MQLDSVTQLDSVAVALVLDKSGSMVVLVVVSAGSSLPGCGKWTGTDAVVLEAEALVPGRARWAPK